MQHLLLACQVNNLMIEKINKLDIARPYNRSGIDSVPYVLYKVRREKCLLKAKRLDHSLVRVLCVDILNPD